MKRFIRVKIVGRNEFWLNAVFVEWEYQFPDRKIVSHDDGFQLIAEDWFEDLQRVAGRCFSKVLTAPEDPGRRDLFRKLFPVQRSD